MYNFVFYENNFIKDVVIKQYLEYPSVFCILIGQQYSLILYRVEKISSCFCEYLF